MPPAGADLEMATAAGPLRLALDRSPEAFAFTTGGPLEWEFSVASSGPVDDWPSLRASVAASVSCAGAEWRSREPAALEARLVASSRSIRSGGRARRPRPRLMPAEAMSSAAVLAELLAE